MPEDDGHLRDLAAQIIRQEFWKQAERRQAESPATAKKKLANPPIRRDLKRITRKQGQFLSFIYYYAKLNGKPPAEADFAAYFRLTAPSVHRMILALEAKSLIQRTPGQARSIRLLVDRGQIPDLL